jgi:hypothetical protein
LQPQKENNDNQESVNDTINKTPNLAGILIKVKSYNEAYPNKPSFKHYELCEPFMVSLLEYKAHFEDHPNTLKRKEEDKKLQLRP